MTDHLAGPSIGDTPIPRPANPDSPPAGIDLDAVAAWEEAREAGAPVGTCGYCSSPTFPETSELVSGLLWLEERCGRCSRTAIRLGGRRGTRPLRDPQVTPVQLGTLLAGEREPDWRERQMAERDF